MSGAARALVLVLALAPGAQAAEPAMVAAPPPARSVRLHLGTQLGFPFIFGVSTMGTFYHRGRPRFDLDLLWEPSAYLQSYSVGAAYHPADRLFFLGLRLRLVELEAPWSRGHRAASDDHLGIGLEAGIRKGLGWQRRVLVNFTVQGTALPTASSNIQWLIGLQQGVSYTVIDREL